MSHDVIEATSFDEDTLRRERTTPSLGDHLTGLGVAAEDGVLDHVTRRPPLDRAVRAVAPSVREAFGPSAALALVLRRDPGLGTEYLTLRVRLPSYGPGTTARIESALAPHAALLDDADFLVTTDFRPAGRDD
ncbi:MAG: hypothetical protein ACRC33_19855 [Gemmataceae bacterium]